MSVVTIADALMTLATLGFGAWGSWVLHARLRNVGSRLLLLSFALFTVYCMFSRLLTEPLLRIVESRAPQLADEFAWATTSLAPALLCLCMSLSFLFAARSIRR